MMYSELRPAPGLVTVTIEFFHPDPASSTLSGIYEWQGMVLN
jgi:hypothetical protein